MGENYDKHSGWCVCVFNIIFVLLSTQRLFICEPIFEKETEKIY